MAAFLRGKQAGMQKDLSAGLLDAFCPDDQLRYGINSQISCFAYDPVQSLLAVGTNESRFGKGKIYVFGQKRVHKWIEPPRGASIKSLNFVANRLISVDARSELALWDLDTGRRIAGSPTPGGLVCIETDPMLDWAFLGLSNGEIVAYDLDRERMSSFRLSNFWREKDPRARGVAIVSLQLHPRDIGQLLIGYTHGAVIYSFKQNQVVRSFEYELPPGAPGGNCESAKTHRKPLMTHAVWHPTGTFILTAHQDGSLVFWDPKDGRVVTARSLYKTRVDQPVPSPDQATLIDPYGKIAWCCKENPDDTALLIAGGKAIDDPEKGLTFLDLGPTPIYATSSWQVLTEHFSGKRQHTIQSPPGAQVSNFWLMPRASPYFAGAQDPIAILSLLSSGEVLTVSFPSGYPISPTNQLHPSLSFVHPFVTRYSVATLDRGRWLGMVENRNQGELLLKGGAPAPKSRRRFEGRNIILVAHADTTVRLWDVGHGDEIDNPTQLQVDVARSVDKYENLEVTAMALAADTGEFAVGTNGGEVVVYRWGRNKFFGNDQPQPIPPNPGGLSEISSRAEPSLKEGLQPLVLYEMMQGPITALKVADVGFVAAGSQNGYFSIVDLRGPTVIYQASVADFVKQEKKSSLFRKSSPSSAKEWPVSIEFGVMTLDEDKYSSIACFVGTNMGNVATFKLLPSGNGYSVKPAGVVHLDSRVLSINPIIAETGFPAGATGQTVAGLRNGTHVNGVLVVVTESEIRLFKPANSKGASKDFDSTLCQSATVAQVELNSFAVVGVFGDRTTRAFSLPGLKEIGKSDLAMLDATRLGDSAVTPTGDIFGWAGPSELAVLHAAGAGKPLEASADTLVNPDLPIPPRPTISNLQWISGTQYISPPDLDLLIGGADRPPSKRMMEAAAVEDRLARTGGGGVGAGSGSAQEGWGEYFSRQLNERTEKLNLMGDNMDHLQNQSQGWADDVNKFVKKQQRNVLLGGIKGKFF